MIEVVEDLKDSNLLFINNDSFNILNMDKYRTWFIELKAKGAFINETNFDDKIWRLTDKLIIRPIDFTINEIDFQKQKKLGKFNFDVSVLESALKAYTLINLKMYDITTVYATIHYIKQCFKKTKFFKTDIFNSFRQEQLQKPKSHVYRDIASSILDFADFFEMMEIDDTYYNLFDAWLDIGKQINSRILPTFTSYFKFQDKITEFIKDLKLYNDAISSESPYSIMALREKYPCDMEILQLKYFPIILWWRLTSWLPMRVTEFTIIPYDCNKIIKGRYMLTIMKSTEKGKGHLGIEEKSHDLKDSFAPIDVEINKDIFNIINEYKSLVDKYDNINNFYKDKIGDAGRREYLLSYRGHIKSLSKKGVAIELCNIFDYFSAATFTRLLNNFFHVIISGVFGMTVYKKGIKKFISVNEIEKIAPMDTRHFSIMNLLMQDISPILIKELAGHKTIETTYSYCRHIDSYIENYSYNLAQKYAKRDISNTNASIINFTLTPNTSSKTQNYRHKILHNEIPYKVIEDGW